MNVQQNRIDMAIEPKSDQINYDDFITGPRTITITGVKGTGNVNDQQPVSVHFQGDNGKPYKPCKSMRRVMVRVWGADAATYVGKSMTLFGEPDVLFGGQKVGGIRISHMSHIDKEMHVPLSASKTKRVLFKILPLKVNMDFPGDNDDANQLTDFDDLYKNAQNAAAQGMDAYKAFFIGLSGPDKNQIKGDHESFKKTATEVDAAAIKNGTDDDEIDF